MNEDGQVFRDLRVLNKASQANGPVWVIYFVYASCKCDCSLLHKQNSYFIQKRFFFLNATDKSWIRYCRKWPFFLPNISCTWATCAGGINDPLSDQYFWALIFSSCYHQSPPPSYHTHYKKAYTFPWSSCNDRNHQRKPGCPHDTNKNQFDLLLVQMAIPKSH